jgi:hypothetical protein
MFQYLNLALAARPEPAQQHIVNHNPGIILIGLHATGSTSAPGRISMSKMIDRAAPHAHLRAAHSTMRSRQRRVDAACRGTSIWR